MTASFVALVSKYSHPSPHEVIDIYADLTGTRQSERNGHFGVEGVRVWSLKGELGGRRSGDLTLLLWRNCPGRCDIGVRRCVSAFCSFDAVLIPIVGIALGGDTQKIIGVGRRSRRRDILPGARLIVTGAPLHLVGYTACRTGIPGQIGCLIDIARIGDRQVAGWIHGRGSGLEAGYGASTLFLHVHDIVGSRPHGHTQGRVVRV